MKENKMEKKKKEERQWLDIDGRREVEGKGKQSKIYKDKGENAYTKVNEKTKYIYKKTERKTKH